MVGTISEAVKFKRSLGMLNRALDFTPERGGPVMGLLKRVEEEYFPSMLDETSRLHGTWKHTGARDVEVLRLRFGLEGSPMLFKEIGVKYGVSASRAQQMTDRALRHLAWVIRDPSGVLEGVAN